MAQIDIDFEVFKALTALREHEGDTYNHVIRRMLKLSTSVPPTISIDAANGLFMGGVLFPNGSRFRGVYKGKEYAASVVHGVWIDSDGTPRNSPSEAAGEISGTNVNGWNFWDVQFPGEASWRRLAELRSK